MEVLSQPGGGLRVVLGATVLPGQQEYTVVLLLAGAAGEQQPVP